MKKYTIILILIMLSFLLTNFVFAKTASTTVTKKITVQTKPKTVVKKITTPAKVKPVVKPKTIAKKTVTPIKAKVTWTAAAIKASKKIPSQIRTAVMKKIENYAIKKKIKTITPAVMNGMRE